MWTRCRRRPLTVRVVSPATRISIEYPTIKVRLPFYSRVRSPMTFAPPPTRHDVVDDGSIPAVQVQVAAELRGRQVLGVPLPALEFGSASTVVTKFLA